MSRLMTSANLYLAAFAFLLHRSSFSCCHFSTPLFISASASSYQPTPSSHSSMTILLRHGFAFSKYLQWPLFHSGEPTCEPKLMPLRASSWHAITSFVAASLLSGHAANPRPARRAKQREATAHFMFDGQV